jgi:hypothetical protein
MTRSSRDKDSDNEVQSSVDNNGTAKYEYMTTTKHRGAYDLSVKSQKMANEFGNLDLLPLAFLDRELFLMVSFKLGGSLVGGFSSEVEAL